MCCVIFSVEGPHPLPVEVNLEHWEVSLQVALFIKKIPLVISKYSQVFIDLPDRALSSKFGDRMEGIGIQSWTLILSGLDRVLAFWLCWHDLDMHNFRWRQLFPRSKQSFVFVVRSVSLAKLGRAKKTFPPKMVASMATSFLVIAHDVPNVHDDRRMGN